MLDLKGICRVLLLKSKALSISCISSVLIAVVMIISMFNLTMNAKASYEDKLHSAYGDIDAIASYQTYAGISDAVIEQMKIAEGMDQVSAGYFDSSFMIDEHQVYLVGSENSNLMKSRYRYHSNLMKNEIVINSTLADSLQCKKDDTIKIRNAEFRVIEIVEDVSGSAASITMAFVNKSELEKIIGIAPNSNFILFSIKDGYNMDFMAEEIRSIDATLDLNIVEADELYKESVESFAMFMNALAVCVIIITGLFVASTLKRFMYKYKHDIAIMRAMGGSKKQVKRIFQYLSMSINLIGCAGGLFFSVFLNRVLLNLINRRIGLIEGEISFYFFRSLGLAVLLFLFLTLILLLSIRKSLKVLPLEAFMENELSQIGKRKKGIKRKALYPFHRLIGKDTYITLKSMFSKFKENVLITSTIVILVVLSFIGGSLSSILQKNNDEYLKRDYLTDIVVTSSNYISYKDIVDHYNQLNKTPGINASITLFSPDYAVLQNEPLSFMIADITAMQKQGVVRDAVTGQNLIVISEELADRFHVIVGDEMAILTPQRYVVGSYGRVTGIDEAKQQYEVQMQVAEIMPRSKMHYMDAMIDISSNDFMTEEDALNRIYISGDLDTAEQQLSQLKNIHTGLKWSNLAEVKKISGKSLKDRFAVFEAVVSILALIAGLGWVNAIRHTILSRKDEYKILRIHGMTIARLRNMLFKHILLYLMIGIIVGVGVGVAVIMLLTYVEGGTSLVVINDKALLLITGFLVLLNMLLIPDVLKVSKSNIVLSE